MSVNLNFSGVQQSFVSHFIAPSHGPAPDRLSSLIPQEWVEAGFCNERGELQMLDNFQETLPNVLLDPLFRKTVIIGNNQISLRVYCNALLEEFHDMDVQIFLRGSYGSYLLDVERHLIFLIEQFTKQFPDRKEAMERGLSKIKWQMIRTEEPDDVDFALSFKKPIANLVKIKNKLIQVNSKLGKISVLNARDFSFKTLFLVKPNDWCSLKDQIVIASLHGDAKCDITVGHMEEAPYLFSMDNHAIVLKEGQWKLGALSKSPWQSFIDRAVGIVRIEKRHAKDFRALLRAVILLSKGAAWDTSPEIVSGYLAPYLNKTAAEIAAELNKKLDDPRLEPVSVVVNFLSLVGDSKQRQSIWEELHPRFSDYGFSFEEAAHQIAEQARAFPELFGAMPLLKIPADKALPASSLPFLKKTLFMDLPPPDENCTGMYAEWRRSCHLTTNSDKRPELVLQTVGTLFLKGLLESNLQEQLARQFQVQSLLDCLVGACDQPAFRDQWLQLHAAKSWTEKLLLLPRNRRRVDYFKSLLEIVENKEEFLVAAWQLKFLPLDDQSQEMLKSYLRTCTPDQAVSFLKVISSKIDEWLLDLWIDAYQHQQIDLPLLQLYTRKWLTNITDPVLKGGIALTLFRRLGPAPFQRVSQTEYAALFQAAHETEKAVLFMQLLRDDITAAALFYSIHELELRPQLPALFHQALQSTLGQAFISLFAGEAALQDAFHLALNKLSQEQRLPCARLLPQERRLSLADDSDILAPKERHVLQIDLLRETKSILLLWKWRKENSSITDKVTKLVYEAFSITKSILITEEEIETMIREGALDQVDMLLGKLDDALKAKTVEMIQAEFEKGLKQGNLVRLRRIASFPRFLIGMPLSSPLNIAKDQLPELLALIRAEKNTELKSHYCQAYVQAAGHESKTLEFCGPLFSILTRFPWHNHVPLLLEAVTAYPRELYPAFRSIEMEFLKKESIQGKQLASLYQTLHLLGFDLPKVQPKSLVEHLTSNLSLLNSSSFVLALLQGCADRTFMKLLLAHLSHEDHFKAWFASHFRSSDPEVQRFALDLAFQNPHYVAAVLEVSRREPSLLGAHVDAFVERYLSSNGSFGPIRHLRVSDLSLLTSLIVTTEGFDENAVDVLHYISGLKRSHPGRRALLEKVVHKALALQRVELLKPHIKLLEEIKDSLDATEMFKAGLKEVAGLDLPQTFQDLVAAIEAVMKKNGETDDDPAVAVLLNGLCTKALIAIVDQPDSCDPIQLELFLKLSESLPLFPETDEKLIRVLNQLIQNEATPNPVKIQVLLLYFMKADSTFEYCLMLLDLLEKQEWNFSHFKTLFFHAFAIDEDFPTISGSLKEMILKNEDQIPPQWKEFFLLIIEINDEFEATAVQMERVIALGKSLEVDLTDCMYMPLFANHLYLYLEEGHDESVFAKNLLNIAMKIAGTQKNPQVKEALSIALQRLIAALISIARNEESSDLFSHTAYRLAGFFKEKLPVLFRNEPDYITTIGRTILYECLIHPDLGNSSAPRNMGFFIHLAIPNEEKHMINLLLGVLTANAEWRRQLSTYYRLKAELQHEIAGKCWQLILKRSSGTELKWMKGLWIFIYNQSPNKQFAFNLLKDALPLLYSHMPSEKELNLWVMNLFDLLKINNIRIKEFKNLIADVSKKKPTLPDRPPLSIEDLKEVAIIDK